MEMIRVLINKDHDIVSTSDESQRCSFMNCIKLRFNVKIFVRPSHIEAYQNEILSECSTHIPTSNNLEDIMTESVVFKPISESMDQILGYVKDHSDSVKRTAEFFKLDSIDIPCTLSESGTRINMHIDSDTIASVPIESVINMQYADILDSVLKKGGR